jgi:hypothetical protein
VATNVSYDLLKFLIDLFLSSFLYVFIYYLLTIYLTTLSVAKTARPTAPNDRMIYGYGIGKDMK